MRERGWKTRAVKRTEAVRWTVSSCHSLCSSPSHTVRSRSLRAVWKGKRWTEWITLVSVARFLSLTSSLCPAVPYSHNRSIVSLSTWQDRDLNIPYRVLRDRIIRQNDRRRMNLNILHCSYHPATLYRYYSLLTSLAPTHSVISYLLKEWKDLSWQEISRFFLSPASSFLLSSHSSRYTPYYRSSREWNTREWR